MPNHPFHDERNKRVVSFDRGLDGLAMLVAKKWFAVMGLVGLLIFGAALVTELPGDRIAVICVSLIMMGYGFGQAECRTFKTTLVGTYQVTGPAWKWSVSGFLLFAVAAGAAIRLAVHLLF